MERTGVPDLGINLTGGGARGSYQAGVLLAIAEILRDHKLTGLKNPLQYWSGVSAGAINTCYCAGGMDDLYGSVQRLVDIWTHIKPNRVYKTDVLSMSKNSIKWIRDLSFGPLFREKLAKSLLDTGPLHDLLAKGIYFHRIPRQLEDGYFKGLACSAYSYREARTVTFLQTKAPCSWDKPKRYSVSEPLTAKHVLASCAIPILFPSVEIRGEYYGDGGFRSTTPISPLIHMGSNKILAVGVRGPSEIAAKSEAGEPSVAQVSGAILNALFFDTIDIDVERIGHMNEILKAIRHDVKTSRSEYTVVDYRVIRPSKDISKIAEKHSRVGLPKTVEFLLAGLGDVADTAELSSYILFDSSFTSELVDLGYKDVMARKTQMENWLLTDTGGDHHG